jgi:hypothetical protein
MAPRQRRRRRPQPKRDRQLTTEIYGGRIRVPNNPPPVGLQPFNNITVQHTIKISAADGSFQYGIALHATAISQQIGLEAERIRMKVQSFRAWNLTSKEFACEFREMLLNRGTSTERPGNSVIASYVDYGSPTTYPSCGYRWAQNFSNYAHTSDDTETTIVTFLGAKDDSVLIRCHTLWSIIPK